MTSPIGSPRLRPTHLPAQQETSSTQATDESSSTQTASPPTAAATNPPAQPGTSSQGVPVTDNYTSVSTTSQERNFLKAEMPFNSKARIGQRLTYGLSTAKTAKTTDGGQGEVTFNFQQGSVLPKDNLGACRAASMDWLRRGLVKDKVSIADVGPKHAGPMAEAAEAAKQQTPEEKKTDRDTATRPGLLSHQRMERKYQRYDVMNKEWTTVARKEHQKISESKTSGPGFTRADLSALERNTFANFKEHLETQAAQGKTGGLSAEQLKTQKLDGIKPEACVYSAQWQGDKMKTFANMMTGILNNDACSKEGAFLVGINGMGKVETTMKDEEGKETKKVIDVPLPHAMAMRQTDSELHFMDPNFGEFKFPRTPGTRIEADSDIGKFLENFGKQYEKQRFNNAVVYEYVKAGE
ncbi:YopT-type cysteine protease domain-containing protein [Myxococcus stipitatus]|uniref:YopT-type cysteine protease domain-containing protein n=1 Tax=Myxococcus stipitatus TaxID=83455 RepID=UPI0030D1BEA5